jgi:SEC-C motif-containing protein
MRSRYCAFANHKLDYIARTWDPATRPESIEGSTGAATVEWLRLQILATQAGGEHDTSGVVEFVASYRAAGQLRQLHEVSDFRKDGGTWWYVSGTSPQRTPTRGAAAKVGRNEPCPCGSNKKFKKCCGAALPV